VAFCSFPSREQHRVAIEAPLAGRRFRKRPCPLGRRHTRASLLSEVEGTPAQGPQGGQWWGEAVPAAGRVQGAGLGAASARRTGAGRL